MSLSAQKTTMHCQRNQRQQRRVKIAKNGTAGSLPHCFWKIFSIQPVSQMSVSLKIRWNVETTQSFQRKSATFLGILQSLSIFCGDLSPGVSSIWHLTVIWWFKFMPGQPAHTKGLGVVHASNDMLYICPKGSLPFDSFCSYLWMKYSFDVSVLHSAKEMVEQSC